MAESNSENDLINLKDLIDAASSYARNNFNTDGSNKSMGQINGLVINPGLLNGCPALQRFCKGCKKLGLTDILEKTIFAWHGTISIRNLVSICHYGFNPDQRRRQLRGNGEYFGVTADNSHSYTGLTYHLLLVQLVSGNHLRLQTGSYVVDNPNDSSCSYSLPVLLVSYGWCNLRPIPFIRSAKAPIPPPYKAPPSGEPPGETTYWHSALDLGNFVLYPALAGKAMEIPDQSTACDKSSKTAPVETECEVIVECQSCPYSLRERAHVGSWAPRHGVKRETSWFWKADGMFRPYPLNMHDIIELHYLNYKDNNGSPKCGFEIYGMADCGTQGFILDFRTMILTNIATGYQRVAERRKVIKPVKDSPFTRLGRRLKQFMSKFPRKSVTSSPQSSPNSINSDPDDYSVSDDIERESTNRHTTDHDDLHTSNISSLPAEEYTHPTSSLRSPPARLSSTSTQHNSPDAGPVASRNQEKEHILGKKLSEIAEPIVAPSNRSYGSIQSSPNDDRPQRVCCCVKCLKAFWRWITC